MPVHAHHVVALAASIAAGAALADTTYTVTDLGSLGGGITKASAINDRGMVTGQSTRHEGDNQGVAFFAYRKKMVGLMFDDASPTWGLGVNADGVVVGYEYSTDHVFGGHPNWPFIWTQAGGKVLLPAGAGVATAIGDDGVVVGWAGPDETRITAASWTNGVATDLGSVGGWPCSGINARNAAGDMVGWAGGCPFSSDLSEHAVTRFDGTMSDLGTFGFQSSEAVGVNASRVVVGNVHSDNAAWGFSWHDGQVKILRGPAGSGATEVHVDAVDDDGRVVGMIRLPGQQQGRDRTHAFLYRAGTWIDLNEHLAAGSGDWVLQEATSINARGEIVGTGRIAGRRASFKLTPVK